MSAFTHHHGPQGSTGPGHINAQQVFVGVNGADVEIVQPQGTFRPEKETGSANSVKQHRKHCGGVKHCEKNGSH